MKSFLHAFQFLTIFRIRRNSELQPQDFLSSLRWFFVVGLVIGLLQWSLSWIVLKYHLPIDVLSLLLVIVGVVVTGGLHLDGAADSADGFGAGQDRESILRIMKDDRTGVYGIATIVLTLFAKILAYSHVLCWETLAVVLIAPMLSRTTVSATCTILPYARNEGTGKAFAGGSFLRHALVPVALAAIISTCFLGVPGLALFGIAVLFSFLFCLYCYWRIKGFTGDTLGAQNELVEIVTLFAGGMLF